VTAMDVPEKSDGATVYLSSTMAAPSEVQLYRISAAKGGEPERLTKPAGTHQAVVSPDGRRFATLYTNDVQPPDLYIAETAPGAPMRRITTSPLKEFSGFGWIAPRYVTFPSRKDGATLHARLILPPDFKQGVRYPLILGSVYNNTVRNRWSAGNAFDLYLAQEHKFVVMNVDIRASTPYGRKFRQATMGDLGGIDLEDLISGVEYLDKQGMIDRERVGIWGWSYGGFLTLMAKFKAPDVFKVGAAGAPVSNWLHDTDWVVPLLGDPKDNAEAYKRTSPITYAGDLKGRLLIVHAMGDERVLFQDTAAVVDKLIQAEKDVDVVWAPKGGHGYDPSDEGQYNRHKRIAEYFIQYLGAGPTQPKR
jgi:dipeptidyl-peptidase-4